MMCPKCPDCGGEPTHIFPYQALCTNEECHVWIWDPTQSARANLEDSGTIDVKHGVQVAGVYEEHPGASDECQHEPCKTRNLFARTHG